jgi:vacuolar-type H+-ATPase subunit F/Vma7
MARIAYVGDEVTAAGFRLAGVETYTPGPAQAAEALRQAIDDDSDCILLSCALAPCVPAAQLLEAWTALRPLLALVADARGDCVAPDVASEVRDALGLDP